MTHRTAPFDGARAGPVDARARMRALFSSDARAGERRAARAGAPNAGWVRDFDDDSDATETMVKTRSMRSTPEGTRAHPLAREWSSEMHSSVVREAFLAESIDAYTTRVRTRVTTGTWNTNGKAPKGDEDVRGWLMGARGEEGTPDVVVVGFQEIVPLHVDKVLAGKDAAATEAWEEVLDRALNGDAARQGATKRRGTMVDYDASYGNDAGEGGGASTSGTTSWVSFDDADVSRRAKSKAEPTYRPVAQKQLVGVYITVWVKTSLLSHLKDVRVASVATGFNIGVGVLGNKGACAVWMKLYSTPLVFVCSHLSAGTKPGDEHRRNEDFATIVDQLRFHPPDGLDGVEHTIEDAASAIWMGDLNYRLNATDKFVRDCITKGTFSQLLACDQLNIERAGGRVFQGWHESELTFAPTYKYRPGTNIYSGAEDADADVVDAGQKKEEEKKRTPAWCDRVLWNGDFDINLLEYGRSELTHSDHKPVHAVFSIVVRELDPQKLNALMFDLRRRLDHVEMAAQPKCAIVNPSVDLGEMLYSSDALGEFTMSNVGDVPAKFSLVSPIPGGPATPGWITVNPMTGSLLPGEEIVLKVRACVQGGRESGPSAFSHDSLSRRSEEPLIEIGAKPKLVEAVLVVRLEGGRDFFVMVKGQYIPCVFGTPLEDLPTTMFPPNCPQVISTLVDYVFENISTAPGIFFEPLDGLRTPRGVAKIAETLQHGETDIDFGALGVNVYDVGEALVSLLSALPRRILDEPGVLDAVDAMKLDEPQPKEFAHGLLGRHLSTKAKAALVHIAALIKRLDEEYAKTGARVHVTEMILTFATCLFPESTEQPNPRRVAFIGALAGCHPSFLRTLRAREVAPPPSEPSFLPGWFNFSVSPEPQESTGNASGNLIDF